MEMNIPCDFGTDEQEFERYVGRKPIDNDEMELWVHYLKKGIDAQLDWNMICECAAENFGEL